MRHRSTALRLLRALTALAILVPLRLAAADDGGVSIIVSRAIAPYAASAQGTQDALREAGVRRVEVHNMAGDASEAGRIADALRKEPPRAIVTVGTEATQAMRRQFSDIPIISSMVVHPETLLQDGEPVVYGASLEVPGSEQLSALKSLLPDARRIGILYNPVLHAESAMDQRRKAAERQGIELVLQPVSGASEIPNGLRALMGRVDALWLIPDETVLAPEIVQNLLLETLRSRLPVLAPSLLFVQRGALMGISGDYQEVGRQAGEMAAMLLSGKRPKSSLVEARKAVLYLNLRSAQALGVAVPQALIDRAEQVIR